MRGGCMSPGFVVILSSSIRLSWVKSTRTQRTKKCHILSLVTQQTNKKTILKVFIILHGFQVRIFRLLIRSKR